MLRRRARRAARGKAKAALAEAGPKARSEKARKTGSGPNRMVAAKVVARKEKGEIAQSQGTRTAERTNERSAERTCAANARQAKVVRENTIRLVVSPSAARVRRVRTVFTRTIRLMPRPPRRRTRRATRPRTKAAPVAGEVVAGNGIATKASGA